MVNIVHQTMTTVKITINVAITDSVSTEQEQTRILQNIHVNVTQEKVRIYVVQQITRSKIKSCIKNDRWTTIFNIKYLDRNQFFSKFLKLKQNFWHVS